MQTLKQNSVLKFTTFILFSLFAMAAVLSCSKDSVDSPAAKTDPPTINEHASIRTSAVAVPYEDIIYVPCANGGAGENVLFNGNTNFLYTISWTDHGYTFGYHANTYGIRGVGLTTGEQFVASGTSEGQAFGSWVDGHWFTVFHGTMNVTSPTTHFKVKNTYHALSTPDGDVLINLREHEVECN